MSNTPEKSNKKVIIVISIAVIALLIVGGLIISNIFKDKKTDTTTKSDSTSQQDASIDNSKQGDIRDGNKPTPTTPVTPKPDAMEIPATNDNQPKG